MTTTALARNPILLSREWQFEGMCRQVHPEVFFHPEGERGSKRRDRADLAKAVCQSCPVLQQCREHALAAREPFGVWGGLTEEERSQVLAAKRRLAS